MIGYVSEPNSGQLETQKVIPPALPTAVGVASPSPEGIPCGKMGIFIFFDPKRRVIKPPMIKSVRS